MKKNILVKEIVEWSGNCPSCKDEQKSYRVTGVDILCAKCIIKEEEIDFKNKYHFLIGSNVTDIYKKLGSNFLKLKLSNQKEYEICIS